MDTTSIIEEAVARSGVSEIATRFSSIITNAERYLNKALKGVAQTRKEITFTTDADGNYLLPSDFGGVLMLKRPMCVFYNTTLEALETNKSTNAYAIDNDKLRTKVSNAEFEFTYYSELPSLATNSTNWLTEKDPEIYVYSLMFAGFTFISPKMPEAYDKAIAIRAQLDNLINEYIQDYILSTYSNVRVNVGSVV